MKRAFLFCLFITLPILAFGQDSINPYNIQQACNIVLHDSDVYYAPFAPPSTHDSRAGLCNESAMLLDPNGINTAWQPYRPVVYDTRADSIVQLQNWNPKGEVLGNFAIWQRLFQARTKPDGTPSDITAGGGAPGSRVTVSANEDVDFRASGRIKLKSGFHVKPGAFFHAYTEPKFDTAVFSDEFDSVAKFNSQWHISNGSGGNYYPEGCECPLDSNVRLWQDTGANGAHDGWAVDLMLREDTVDSTNCPLLTGTFLDACGNILRVPDTSLKFIFSSGMIRSCPFPYSQRVDSPLVSAYLHAPYGKYEIRDKIPQVEHHTNNWGIGYGYGFEWDLNETDGGNMTTLNPNFNHNLRFGPCTGHFGKLGSTTIFYSSDPQWCPSNNPASIIINNVPYAVMIDSGHGMDTVESNLGDISHLTGWPASLTADTTAPILFYYTITQGLIADTLHWKVTQDDSGRWRIFSAAYHDSVGHLLHFSKVNQPKSITLTTAFRTKKTFNCHWEYTLNYPIDSGKLLIDTPGLALSDLDSNTEAYGFSMNYLSPSGYPVCEYPFDTTGGVRYHTFGMEWLPHEIRILYDSVVIRRLPDRLVPRGSPYYDWISQLPRTLINILPAEIDIDHASNGGPDSTEQAFFEHAASIPGWPGFETVDGKPVAHHLIDYIKIWDVPKDVKIPNLPY